MDTKQEVARALSDRLVIWCRESGYRSIALSGGSTPKLWFDLLAAAYEAALPWTELQFFWGDERCVPPEDPESNYGMTRRRLLEKVPVPGDHIHRIRGEAPPAEEAIRYGHVLGDHLPLKGNIPQFDLVVLGMGADGHTASIFPHEISLWDAASPCVVATHPETGQKRISISGGVINNARQVVFLVTGSEKAGRVRQIHRGLAGSEGLPAARVAPKDGKLLWLLDAGAASGLQ
mgnify:CR=1 FL=1